MTAEDPISSARAAGVTLHGLAVFEAAMDVEASASVASWPVERWRWSTPAGSDSRAAVKAVPTPLFLDSAGIVGAAHAGEWQTYRTHVRNLTPAMVASYFFGDSLGSLARRPEAGGFSEADYRALYPKVGALVDQGVISSCLEHYVRTGAALNNNPNQLFRERYYLTRYSDVREAVAMGGYVSGFHHFLSAGQREGRSYRPGDGTAAAVDLTYLATKGVDGRFVGYAVSILAAIVRLLRGVEFTFLLPDGAYDAFSPWDSENVRRLVVPVGIRRPARELLALRPDILVSFGRPSLFRGDERATMTFLPDQEVSTRVGFRVESGGVPARKGVLRFVDEVKGISMLLDADGPKVPFAVQKSIRDDTFPRLITALTDAFQPKQAFAPSQELIGVDEHGTMGSRSFINARTNTGATLVVLLHCPEERPRQDLHILVKDASATILAQRSVAVLPGQYLWEEIALPSGLVQVEFVAAAPQKVFVDGRWRTFFSVRFVDARLRQVKEEQLKRPGQAELTAFERRRSGVDAFEYLAGYKGGVQAREVLASLRQLAKVFPAYRSKLRQLRWDEELLRRPRFLIVVRGTKKPVVKRLLDRRVECLQAWAEKAGFEPVVRECSFAPGWVRSEQLGIKWRDVDCCMFLGPTKPDEVSLIREINDDAILLGYRLGLEQAWGHRPPTGLERLMGRLRDEHRVASGKLDYEFFDHLPILRTGRLTIDSPESDRCFLPMYPRDPTLELKRRESRRCGIFVSSRAVLRTVLRDRRWVQAFEGLKAANGNWKFCFVCAEEAVDADEEASARLQTLGMEVRPLIDPCGMPADVRCMIFWEADPANYLEALVENVARSVNCLVDSRVRAGLSRTLYVHTSSVTMPGEAFSSARLDDLIFEFDGANVVRELERIFERNLSDVFTTLSEQRFSNMIQVVPNYWS